MRPYHQFTVEERGNVTVIRLCSSRLLDPIISHELTEELLSFIGNCRPATVVVTFANVKRFSSDIINTLLMTREKAAQVGCHLVLCDLRPEIRPVFSLLQLDLPMVNSLDEALKLHGRNEAMAAGGSAAPGRD